MRMSAQYVLEIPQPLPKGLVAQLPAIFEDNDKTEDAVTHNTEHTTRGLEPDKRIRDHNVIWSLGVAIRHRRDFGGRDGKPVQINDWMKLSEASGWPPQNAG